MVSVQYINTKAYYVAIKKMCKKCFMIRQDLSGTLFTKEKNA